MSVVVAAKLNRKKERKKLKLPSHSRSSPVEDFVVLSHTHTSSTVSFV